MRHFFSKGTVQASIWCIHCHRETMWAVAGGRPLHCQVCQAKPLDPVKRPVDRPTSGDLFDH
jgi:hypothetical protein